MWGCSSAQTPPSECALFHSSQLQTTPGLLLRDVPLGVCRIAFRTVTTIRSFFALTDPAKPLLTWYSATERTELSGATLSNWVAKMSNLLVNECGLGPGDVAEIDLPPHWQTAVILLASWNVGLTAGESGDVSFGLPGSGAEYTLTLHPLQQSDWVVAVRAHGDHYSGPTADVGEVLDLGLKPGDRALFNVDTRPDPREWLLAPLAAGASIVACTGLDETALAKTFAAEKATWPVPQTP